MLKHFEGIDDYPFLKPLLDNWKDLLLEYKTIQNSVYPWWEWEIQYENEGWYIYGLYYKGEPIPQHQKQWMD